MAVEAQGETIAAPAGADDMGALWAQASAMADAAESGEEAPAVADGAESEPVAESAPKAKPKAAPADSSDDRKQLEALAKKLGLTVDANRVEVSERIRLREERQQHREKVARREAELAAKANELGTRAEKLATFEQAHEKGDLDAMARSVGHKDWRALVDDQTKRLASPEYREIQQLKRESQERAERDKSIESERAQREKYEATAREIEAYKVGLAGRMRDAGGELEGMAADPDIVGILYQVQADHYTRTGDELDLDELLDTPSRVTGGKTTLALLREKWESLSKIFGNQTAEESEAAQAVAHRSGVNSAKQARKPPKTVSQKNATEVSAPKKFESEAEYMRHFTQLLNESTHTTG